MTAAMRTVFMFSFGREALMPEDFNERPVLWPQFCIAMREQQLLETTAVNPPAEIIKL